jgi:hypothetical protein
MLAKTRHIMWKEKMENGSHHVPFWHIIASHSQLTTKTAQVSYINRVKEIELNGKKRYYVIILRTLIWSKEFVHYKKKKKKVAFEISTP